MRRVVLSFVAGLSIGGTALLALGVGDHPEPTPDAEPAVVEHTRVIHEPADGPSLAAIRQAIQTELDARDDHDAPVASAPEPLDPERQAYADAAYADATQILDAALARGVWGDEDAAALRSQLWHMDAGQIDETLDTLVLAINEQRVSVTTQGPPF